MTARATTVTTWNVLHRIHAVNWKEAPLLQFPDESVRIEKIAAMVAGFLASGSTAVCLQEVSGDQLASLRSVIHASVSKETVTFFDHQYPRVPKLHVEGGPSVLADRTEHLVTIVANANARHVGAETFSRDPGKGHLAIAVGSTTIINMHVTYGKRRDEQIALSSTVARAEPDTPNTTVIIVGDFNAEIDAVRAALGEGFVLSDLKGQPFTRIKTDGSSRTIDHVAVLRGAIASARVIDCGGLSDHNPVVAEIVPA